MHSDPGLAFACVSVPCLREQRWRGGGDDRAVSLGSFQAGSPCRQQVGVAPPRCSQNRSTSPPALTEAQLRGAGGCQVWWGHVWKEGAVSDPVFPQSGVCERG
ncbi:MAG: hypothetical protein ACK559_36120, partial [bacterium]